MCTIGSAVFVEAIRDDTDTSSLYITYRIALSMLLGPVRSRTYGGYYYGGGHSKSTVRAHLGPV